MKRLLLSTALAILALVSPVQASGWITTMAYEDAKVYWQRYPRQNLDILEAMDVGLSIALKQRNLTGDDATQYEVEFGNALACLYKN